MEKRYKLTIILLPTAKQALSDYQSGLFAKSAVATGGYSNKIFISSFT